MRKFNSFVLVSLITIFSSCTFFNNVSTSSLVVNLPGAQSRSLSAASISSYEVSLLCVENGYTDKTTAVNQGSNLVEFKNLVEGNYEVTVSAFDRASQKIAEGKDTVKVSYGKTAEALVILHEIAGAGFNPVAVWSGKSDDIYRTLTIYRNSTASDFGVSFSSEYSNFAFDSYGNFYGVSTAGVKKCSYVSASKAYGDEVSIFPNDPDYELGKIFFYRDVDSDVFFIFDKQNNNVFTYGNGKLNQIPGSYYVSGVAELFAVHDKEVYKVNNSDNTIYKTASYNTGTITPTNGQAAIVFGSDTDTGLTDSNDMSITDMQFVGNYLYVLVRQLGTGFKSRGAVVKYSVNQYGSLTYVGKLGWYETGTALNTTIEGRSLKDFLPKYFAGPAKIVAVRPKELVIADDGGYFYSDGSNCKGGNINRLVTVDLEKFAISEYHNVDALFNYEVADSGSQFDEISFNGSD